MEIRRQRVLHEDGREPFIGDLKNCVSDNGSLEVDRYLDTQQIRIAARDEYVGQRIVQAFVTNNSFPQSVEELRRFIYEFNVEMILSEEDEEWTVPKWAKIGDVVFFMHTKTAKTTITRLRTEIQQNKEEYTQAAYNLLIQGINRGLELYKKYGGKIYAIGRVAGGPDRYLSLDDGIVHWNSNTYAVIDNITKLETPIDISEFNDFLYITRGATVTGVFGDNFNKLMKLIEKKNSIPDYYKECRSSLVPLREVNRENWAEVAFDHRIAFILESQFRKFFVDNLLREIGDRKTFWEECRCRKSGINDSFIDNVILFNGKYLSVEVKLSIAAEADLEGQVRKYCYNTYVQLDKEKIIDATKMHDGRVLIVDTYALYMYRYEDDTIEKIYDFDSIEAIKDSEAIKGVIAKAI